MFSEVLVRDFTAADVFRFIGFALYGLNIGVVIWINFQAWQLRSAVAGPPRVVPWHVSAISLAWFISFSWNAKDVLDRMGTGFTAYIPLFIFLGILYLIAFRIIGGVQYSRRAVSDVVEKKIKDNELS